MQAGTGEIVEHDEHLQRKPNRVVISESGGEQSES